MRARIVVWMVVCAVMGFVMTPLLSAQTADGPSGTVSASVPSFLEFAFSDVYQMSVAENDSDPFLDGTLQASPDFNFGNLTAVRDVDDSVLYMSGEFWYAVMMIASTSGRRYKISETGTQLTGTGTAAGATLPVESVLLVSDYQWLDTLGGTSQGAPPGGATVGTVTTASGTDSLVYQSDGSGLGRMVRAYIVIGGPPEGETYPVNYSLGHNGSTPQGTKNQYTAWQPITPDQLAGPYGGTITFTLTLN